MFFGNARCQIHIQCRPTIGLDAPQPNSDLLQRNLVDLLQRHLVAKSEHGLQLWAGAPHLRRWSCSRDACLLFHRPPHGLHLLRRGIAAPQLPRAAGETPVWQKEEKTTEKTKFEERSWTDYCVVMKTNETWCFPDGCKKTCY